MQNQLPVKQLMDLWPALRMQSELYTEFQQLQNLPNTLYTELDRHTPQLMALFRQKASKTRKIADALFDVLKYTMNGNYVISTQGVLLFSLPFPCICVTKSLDFLQCVDDVDEPDLGDASVGLRTTVSDDAMDLSLVHHHSVKTCCPVVR